MYLLPNIWCDYKCPYGLDTDAFFSRVLTVLAKLHPDVTFYSGCSMNYINEFISVELFSR